MSTTAHNPLSSLLPDAIMQVSAEESEQDLSVSCLNRLPLAFDDNIARFKFLARVSLPIPGTCSLLVAFLL